jgi:hypothetical protein
MPYVRRFSVVIDPQGVPNYQSDIEMTLTDIAKTKTGMAIFHKIVAHGVVRIKPYSAAMAAKWGKCNALAFGEEHQEEVDGGLHRKAVDVEYTRTTWTGVSRCFSGPGAMADEILAHELVHAMRNLGGDSKQVPLTGAMAGYENEEEYFAVLVTNILTSELGRQPTNWLVGSGNVRSGLRADHKGFNNLDDNQSIATDFLMNQDNYRLVKKFCDQHPRISREIGEANARFNPIKIFYRWRSLGIQPQQGHFVRK